MTDEGSRDELRALRMSLVVTTVYTVGAFAVAFLSDSETMSLEALSGLVDVVVSLLAVLVARKIQAPADDRYHFGYAKYEPLMIAVEGVLIAAVCLAAISYAIRDLIHPDPVDDPTLIVLYSFAGFLVSIVFGAYMKRLGRRAESPLVLAEADLWIIDGWLTLGVCVAFAVTYVFSSTAMDPSAYVDPAVCIALSLIFLRKPIEILRESLADLLDANPYAEARNVIEQSARECVERYGLQGLDPVRIRKAGRRRFAIVSFVLGPNESSETMERVRRSVIADLTGAHQDLDVSVMFRGA